MIIVKDNFLEEHIAQLIDGSVHNTDFNWHWHYKANKNEPDRHWHTLAGHDIEEMTTNHLKNAIKSVEKNVQDGYINYPTCFDNMCKELHNRGIDPDSLLDNFWDR